MFVFRLRVPGVSLSVALKSVGLFDFLRFVNVVLTAAVVALLQPWPQRCVPCHACLAQDLFAEEAFELYCRHISCMENEGVFTPKHHLLFHLIANSARLGNPTLYATWKSEAMSKVLKGACRHTSQATFERSVLLRMRHLPSADRPKRKSG